MSNSMASFLEVKFGIVVSITSKNSFRGVLLTRSKPKNTCTSLWKPLKIKVLDWPIDDDQLLQAKLGSIFAISKEPIHKKEGIIYIESPFAIQFIRNLSSLKEYLNGIDDIPKSLLQRILKFQGSLCHDLIARNEDKIFQVILSHPFKTTDCRLFCLVVCVRNSKLFYFITSQLIAKPFNFIYLPSFNQTDRKILLTRSVTEIIIKDTEPICKVKSQVCGKLRAALFDQYLNLKSALSKLQTKSKSFLLGSYSGGIDENDLFQVAKCQMNFVKDYQIRPKEAFLGQKIGSIVHFKFSHLANTNLPYEFLNSYLENSINSEDLEMKTYLLTGTVIDIIPKYFHKIFNATSINHKAIGTFDDFTQNPAEFDRVFFFFNMLLKCKDPEKDLFYIFPIVVTNLDGMNKVS